jgi:Na+-driven multidrug efflux pump
MFYAALATAISYTTCFCLYFGFIFKSEMQLKCVILNLKQIVKEITELSFVTFFTTRVVSILDNLEP